MVTLGTQGMEIQGHAGKWYVIDGEYYGGRKYYLLENDQYGEDAAHIIVNCKGKVVLDNVFDGWYDLEAHLDL